MDAYGRVEAEIIKYPAVYVLVSVFKTGETKKTLCFVVYGMKSLLTCNASIIAKGFGEDYQ